MAYGVFGVFGVCFILFFRIFPLCELAVKIFKFGLTQFLSHIRIDVQGRGNIRMSQRILNHLDIHARFAHPGRESMPQGMAAEPRQEYGAVRVLRQYFIVAVPDDAPDGLVQRSLMLALAKAVDKDEVRVAIYRYGAMDLCFFLIGTFLFKSFFHKVHHWNGTDTSLRFGRVAVEVTAFLAAVVLTMVVVDQRVIDGDRVFLKIYIAPAQTRSFSYAQARPSMTAKIGYQCWYFGVLER